MLLIYLYGNEVLRIVIVRLIKLIELGNGIDGLIDNPELGVICDYVTKYRQYLKNHHIIYYRIEGFEIVIVRVLHERMEPERHL